MKDSEISAARGKKLHFQPSTQPKMVIETTVRHVNAVAQSRSGEIVKTVEVTLPRVKFLERPEVAL